MDNPLLSMDDAQARLEAWKANSERLAAETIAAGASLQELRVTGTDDNRIAVITVDSGGALVAVTLNSRVHRQAPELTQDAIMGAYRAAKANLAAAAAEIVRGTVGTDTATGRALLAGFAPGDEPEGP